MLEIAEKEDEVKDFVGEKGKGMLDRLFPYFKDKETDEESWHPPLLSEDADTKIPFWKQPWFPDKITPIWDSDWKSPLDPKEWGVTLEWTFPLRLK